jgi:hypothetical protein
MLERVAAHQSADMMFDHNGVEPLCSNEERWLRGEKWAVMKGSAKRATKLCATRSKKRLNMSVMTRRSGLSTQTR